jgi:ribosomal protein S3
MVVSGKLGRRPRAKTKLIFRGYKYSVSTVRIKAQYAYKQCVSIFGVYGVKMWLYYL